MRKLLLQYMLIALLLSGVHSCTKNQISTDNGYDQICQIYITIMNNQKYVEMPLSEKMDIIGSKINITVSSKSAIQAHQGYVTAIPKIRYELLQKVAQHELNRPWNCAILRNWESVSRKLR